MRLVNACGVGVASHMLLTAEPVDAQQALQWHLVTKVVPHERLIEEAETIARQILRNSQRAVRSAKETIADFCRASDTFGIVYSNSSPSLFADASDATDALNGLWVSRLVRQRKLQRDVHENAALIFIGVDDSIDNVE